MSTKNKSEVDEFEEIIKNMEMVAEYDGEKVLNEVLDHYKELIKENPRGKGKVHKFLVMNERLREITKEQEKIIEYCKSHRKIYPRELERLLEYNLEKEEIVVKVLKLFPNKDLEEYVKKQTLKSKKVNRKQPNK
jgi:hypothetical protein